MASGNQKSVSDGLEEMFTPELKEEQYMEPKVSPRLAKMDEEDEADMLFIEQAINDQLRKEYAQAFALEAQLLAKVRVLTPDKTEWVQNADGSFLEDWSRITLSDMEMFIQAASAEAFFSSQKVVDSYAEAVFAKFAYEDDYDTEYARILIGTINDKTSKAKRRTQKQRWVALFKTLYYKKAKEVVDRLDNHVRRVERIYSERQKEAERSFRAARGELWEISKREIGYSSSRGAGSPNSVGSFPMRITAVYSSVMERDAQRPTQRPRWCARPMMTNCPTRSRKSDTIASTITAPITRNRLAAVFARI